MVRQELGRLEEVDLRAIWSDEARDFTPWLADHLEELGKALHLDMHLVEAEGAIGPFAADIIADGENGLVVIENQLERSDHGHLGQLLTYAAGRDARTLIWIAPELRDEHRAAINWLNRWTQREIAIYGVVVRAVRVENSLPAPVFLSVASPGSSRPIRSVRRDSDQGEVERWLLECIVRDPDGYVLIDDVWKALCIAFNTNEAGRIQGLHRASLAKQLRTLFPDLPQATRHRAHNRKRGWQGWRLSHLDAERPASPLSSSFE